MRDSTGRSANTMSLPEAVYHAVYRRRRDRWLRAAKSETEIPIISVGNISTGGTGKTPAVQWIVREMQARGYRPAIVARGYGGTHSQNGAIVTDGQNLLLDAHAAGDEPLLHARNLPGVPVVIGRDRVAAVERTIKEFYPTVIVLDDAFQYWSLPRDVDLVLLDARRPFGNGRLLPVGRLREPPAQLQRADAILLTRADFTSPQQLERTREIVRRWTDAPIWTSLHAPASVRDETSGEVLPLKVLSGADVATISALADNTSFIATLKSCGCSIGTRLMKRDHHRWNEREVRDFARTASLFLDSKLNSTGAIVTTEKDAVKMQPQWTAPSPLWSLVIQLKVNNGDSLIALMEDKIARVGSEVR